MTNVHIDNNDYTLVPSGQIWIHHAWSGDMAAAPYYLPKGVTPDVLGYWFPQDGKGPVATTPSPSSRARRTRCSRTCS